MVIHRMSAIFRRAKLTIIAACGEHADAGLPGVSAIRSKEQGLFCHRPSQSGLVLSLPTLSQALEDTHWKSRAWRFQEQMLSRRCLYFTERETFFTCTHEYREACQIHGSPQTACPVPYVALSEGDRATSMLARRQRLAAGHKLDYPDYASIVEEFTTKGLSLATDRLPAFLGFMPSFVRAEHCVTGIPARFIAEALTWYFVEIHTTASKRIPKDSARNRTFASLPSWSWAFWEGPVGFWCRLPNDAKLFTYTKLTPEYTEGKPNGRAYEVLGIEDSSSPDHLHTTVLPPTSACLTPIGSTPSKSKTAAAIASLMYAETSGPGIPLLKLRTVCLRCRLHKLHEPKQFWTHSCHYVTTVGYNPRDCFAGLVQVPPYHVVKGLPDHLYDIIVIGGIYDRVVTSEMLERRSSIHALVVIPKGRHFERIGFAEFHELEWANMVAANLVDRRWVDIVIK